MISPQKMDHDEISVYSCHSHNATMNNGGGVTHPGTVALLIILLLCAITSNAALVYVLRRFRRHIDWVVTYYSSLFALTDILKGIHSLFIPPNSINSMKFGSCVSCIRQ